MTKYCVFLGPNGPPHPPKISIFGAIWCHWGHMVPLVPLVPLVAVGAVGPSPGKWRRAVRSTNMSCTGANGYRTQKRSDPTLLTSLQISSVRPRAWCLEFVLPRVRPRRDPPYRVKLDPKISNRKSQNPKISILNPASSSLLRPSTPSISAPPSCLVLVRPPRTRGAEVPQPIIYYGSTRFRVAARLQTPHAYGIIYA